MSVTYEQEHKNRSEGQKRRWARVRQFQQKERAATAARIKAEDEANARALAHLNFESKLRWITTYGIALELTEDGHGARMEIDTNLILETLHEVFLAGYEFGKEHADVGVE